MLRIARTSRLCHSVSQFALPSSLRVLPHAVPHQSISTHAGWCAAKSDPDVLPIVEIRADAKLLRVVTREIVEEAGRKQKQTTASRKHKRKASPQPEDDANEQPTDGAAAVAAAGGPVALDDVGWQVWTDISKPFSSPAEEAEFAKWQKVLADQEKEVDREMEDETEGEAMDEEEEASEEEEEEEEKEGETASAAAAREAATSHHRQVIADSMKALQALEQEGVQGQMSSAAKAPPSPTKPAAKAASSSSASPPSKREAKQLASKGVVEDGVRTRMLNVGGEQVMEISGVDDEDDLDGEDAAEPEWDEDIDLGEAHPSQYDKDDPEARVGAGVGGVSFTRKELTELNENDLIESYTKGSGRGGQKMNKTTSCVQLLHLPTGTRVKCQYSRELQLNRARARAIMKDRLEELLLGSQSRTQLKAAKERKKKDRNRRRRAKKLADKAAEQETEEGENDEPEPAAGSTEPKAARTRK